MRLIGDYYPYWFKGFFVNWNVFWRQNYIIVLYYEKNQLPWMSYFFLKLKSYPTRIQLNISLRKEVWQWHKKTNTITVNKIEFKKHDMYCKHKIYQVIFYVYNWCKLILRYTYKQWATIHFEVWSNLFKTKCTNIHFFWIAKHIISLSIQPDSYL